MGPSRISMIGAGNVATHLSRALVGAGYSISQVFSRTQKSASLLAQEFGAIPFTNFNEFDDSCDVVVLALSDSVLEEIIDKIPFSCQLVLHTSGSMPIDIFKNKVEHYGVLYPLQTFSKQRKIFFGDIPLFIEASSSKDLANLKTLATKISTKIFYVESNQRRQVHLSAIFANNFANHMFALSHELIKETGLTFDILKPLILETTLKAIESNNPRFVQTGPAVRMNKNIIKKHIEMLREDVDLQNLYTFASNNIAKMHHNHKVI